MKTASLVVLSLALAGIAGCHNDDKVVEHAALKGPVADFHAVFGPIWHMEKGPARVAKACDHAHKMQELANAAVGAPGVNKGAAQDLSGAVSALSGACSGNRGDVDVRLNALHNAFHKVSGDK